MTWPLGVHAAILEHCPQSRCPPAVPGCCACKFMPVWRHSTVLNARRSGHSLHFKSPQLNNEEALSIQPQHPIRSCSVPGIKPCRAAVGAAVDRALMQRTRRGETLSSECSAKESGTRRPDATAAADVDARIPHGVAQLVFHMFFAAERNANKPHHSRDDRNTAESLRNGFRTVFAHAAVATTKAVVSGAVKVEALFCDAMLLQEASRAVSLSCAISAVPRSSLHCKAAVDHVRTASVPLELGLP